METTFKVIVILLLVVNTWQLNKAEKFTTFTAIDNVMRVSALKYRIGDLQSDMNALKGVIGGRNEIK